MQKMPALSSFAFSLALITSVFSAPLYAQEAQTAQEPAYKLVLLRHGQSQWNLEKKFTGWSDVALTDKGKEGALKAGELIKKEGLKIDEVHTSKLSRAVMTANLALEGMDKQWLPVEKYWRLNERCYGDLEGKTHDQAKKESGEEQVKIWRRSFDVPPPPLAATDPRSPVNDERYADLDRRAIPASESLKDVIGRVGPYWTDQLLPTIKAGKTVMVVGHSTGLRALSSWIEPNLDEKALQKLEIGNTKPIVYEFDKDMKVINRKVLTAPKEEKAVK